MDLSKEVSKNTEPMNEEKKEAVTETPETETVPEAEVVQEPTAEEKLQTQLSELNDRYLRTLAEYDNYRKRTTKEKEAIYPEAKANTLASMLPVLDNFERAMAAPCSDADFKKGMELIRKSFDELMEKEGVEAFGAVGEPFDPQFHAAVAHTDDESAGENCIAEVFQKGYRMGDRVLRYAMVKVAN